MDIPADHPLFALDRLNSWVRSKEGRDIMSAARGLREVIYSTKIEAILQATKGRPVEMRRLKVSLECRTCDGSGTWYHWADDEMADAETCRNCKGTGRATLYFVESKIGPITWHTPAERWRSASLDVYVPFPAPYEDDQWELAEGWAPNQPGKPLTAAEALADVLTMVRAWPHKATFALDFHLSTKLNRRDCPDVAGAEEFIRNYFATRNQHPK